MWLDHISKHVTCLPMLLYKKMKRSRQWKIPNIVSKTRTLRSYKNRELKA